MSLKLLLTSTIFFPKSNFRLIILLRKLADFLVQLHFEEHISIDAEMQSL